MKQFFIGIAMILTGAIGLSMTVCGLVFLFDSGGWALFGLIPGGLLLWATRVLWRTYRKSDKS